MSSGVPFKRWVRLLRALCYLNSGACLVERRVCHPQPKDLLPPLSHNPLCHQQFHLTAHKQMHWSLTVEEESCWEWGLFIKRVDCCPQSGTWKTFWLTPERWINTSLMREILITLPAVISKWWCVLRGERFVHGSLNPLIARISGHADRTSLGLTLRTICVLCHKHLGL